MSLVACPQVRPRNLGQIFLFISLCSFALGACSVDDPCLNLDIQALPRSYVGFYRNGGPKGLGLNKFKFSPLNNTM